MDVEKDNEMWNFNIRQLYYSDMIKLAESRVKWTLNIRLIIITPATYLIWHLFHSRETASRLILIAECFVSTQPSSHQFWLTIVDTYIYSILFLYNDLANSIYCSIAGNPLYGSIASLGWHWNQVWNSLNPESHARIPRVGRVRFS